LGNRYETLKRITKDHPEHKFYFIFDRKHHPDFIFSNNVIPIIASPPARHPILYYFWFEWIIPGVLKKIKADLFFSPDGYLSLRTKVPSVNVVHDLNFEHYPKDLPPFARRHYRYFFPKYVMKAQRVLTVSHFSKNDITSLYNKNPDFIDVTCNGINSGYKTLTAEEVQIARTKFTAGKPYFVFIGALHPRKNLSRLFQAFDLFCRFSKSDYKLLIIGEKMWWTKDIKSSYDRMTYKEQVVFTGRLYGEDVFLAIGGASALTYVSYFEGFGIPIIEAFRAGIPVITSNASSMPEVAGDAALICNPFSVKDICSAMIRISSDEKLRSELVRKGYERQSLYSWNESASLVWKTLEKVINQNT